MIRIAVFLASAVLLALLLGARSADSLVSDPLRVAWLTDEAVVHARAADAALEATENLMRGAIDEARRAQAAVVGGTEDPTAALEAAGLGFEAAATPLTDAHAALIRLGWTLRAIDPRETSPQIGLLPADLVAVGAQWLAAALPSAALGDMRRQAESTLEALDDGLAALDDDDPSAALEAIDRATGHLEQVRDFQVRDVDSQEASTLAYWVDTVDALIGAARDIALAAQAGDAAALAAAQAAYEAAATNAGRADQALTIALGEAATGITGPASTSSADALRAVGAARDQLAGLSILR
ncbi:MAG TPA: hypothetical protein VMK30_04455 [Pleomorphomonadaceae bacterium]|nr:hypothetical protein [Pleomorphomonadaceae bacterium]